MTRRPWTALLLIAALTAATSPAVRADGTGCTRGSEFEPPLCPFALPPIVRVVIEENAAKSVLEKDPAVDCSGFKVTEGLVREYLARAQRVPSGAGHATLDWSPCSASGTLWFKDGGSARWYLSQFRVGSLLIEGQPTQTLFCPRCKVKPFAW